MAGKFNLNVFVDVKVDLNQNSFYVGFFKYLAQIEF